MRGGGGGGGVPGLEDIQAQLSSVCLFVQTVERTGEPHSDSRALQRGNMLYVVPLSDTAVQSSPVQGHILRPVIVILQCCSVVQCSVV